MAEDPGFPLPPLPHLLCVPTLSPLFSPPAYRPPQRVTEWNIALLRQLVENGAEVLPGATHVEDERGHVISLAGMDRTRRRAIARTLLAAPAAAAEGGSTVAAAAVGAAAAGASAAGKGAITTAGGDSGSGRRRAAKLVYRHMRDGDVVLVNRQVGEGQEADGGMRE